MILLVRHAEAGWTLPGTNSVVADPELTPNGVRQAACLGERLRRENPSVLVTSPLRRAAATYEVVAGEAAGGNAVQQWLREIRYPDWRGWKLADVREILERYDGEAPDQRWLGPEGGEPARDHVAAVRAGAQAFLLRHGIVRTADPALWEIAEPGRRIAMIGHVGSIAPLVALLLGLESVAWERQRFAVPNASITRLTPVRVGYAYAFGLTRLGDNSFIPESAQTH